MVSFPGNVSEGRKATYYVCQITGKVRVTEAGEWTLACGSDDGFRCILTDEDGKAYSFEYFRDRSYDTTIKTFNFAKAGVYDLYLIYFEYGDASVLDLSCAKGKYSRFNKSAFKLLGTPASGIPLVGKEVPQPQEQKDGLYMVIDLSGGKSAANYPVSYLNSVPAGGWTDEYKTTKLVMRRIEPGTFTMGDYTLSNMVQVTLSKPYYMGVFEVSQKQYGLVMGQNPSYAKGAALPVECVSWRTIRGSNKWPVDKTAAASSFVGLIQIVSEQSSCSSSLK
jgi:hypothetical protein